MSNENRHIQDEALLIDFLMGHCDSDQQQTIADRLETDPEFAQRHRNLEHTFAAMKLDPDPRVPDDLVARTMSHINSQTQLDALLTQQATGKDRSAWRSPRQWISAAAIVLLLAAAVLPWISKFNTGQPVGPGVDTKADILGSTYNPNDPKFEDPETQPQLIMIVPRLAAPDPIDVPKTHDEPGEMPDQ
jgi:anti-sigma-K factor RskA